jgi:diguanylate cyclase (GGDEF)-like protein/PAS domain S-box-containing protein
MQELEKAQFAVTADVVLTLTECTQRFRSQPYDVVIAEYPNPHWEGPQSLKLLHQTVQQIPLLFLITASGSESIAELTAHGAFDYFEREHIAQLPMAVRRVLNEKKLRIELEEAARALQHSRSQYHALVNNPAYGICRCDAEGKFLDVNQALLTMLGYPNKEELLAANRSSEIVLDLGPGPALDTQSPVSTRIDPVEVEWKRKNGTILRVKLSGQGVHMEEGHFAGYEIIVVDVTEQRELENQLRRQASSDPLTGLANHRRLFELLQAEVGRSKRTGREFTLVLLDLDGLKDINDRFGHLAGDQALRKLAHILTDCCRSGDTPARQGGDEFALLLPEVGPAAATLVTRRICDLLAKDTEEPALSVSIGIASFPQDADGIASLIHAADVALYTMKGKQLKRIRSAGASAT